MLNILTWYPLVAIVSDGDIATFDNIPAPNDGKCMATAYTMRIYTCVPLSGCIYHAHLHLCTFEWLYIPCASTPVCL